MKKLLKIFFLFSVLALCSCNSNKNKEFYTTNKSENGFYLISSPVPKKVVDYAKEIFVKEKLTGIAIKDVNNLELSEPYSIKENIFSFFVILYLSLMYIIFSYIVVITKLALCKLQYI